MPPTGQPVINHVPRPTATAIPIRTMRWRRIVATPDSSTRVRRLRARSAVGLKAADPPDQHGDPGRRQDTGDRCDQGVGVHASCRSGNGPAQSPRDGCNQVRSRPARRAHSALPSGRCSGYPRGSNSSRAGSGP